MTISGDTALSNSSVPSTLVRRSAGVPVAGIVHLGMGNFHRAHQAVYTDAAIAAKGGDWGIIGVANRSRVLVENLRRQDMLYTVVDVSPRGNAFCVPRVHTDALVAADEPERLVTAIGAASTKIVSLTVTENGYTYSAKTGGLDWDDQAVKWDLSHPLTPKSPIGQIVRGLQRRASTHGEGLSVLSCDNLADNGHHTKKLVREFAAQIPGVEGADLTDWISANVTFPSSMVDRIVPSTTDRHRQIVLDALGLVDAIPVPGEPFSMFIVEDNFTAGRPFWEAGGAVFSSEVANYEQLKMRLLNGTHSLIAYLGALAGSRTIPESISHSYIEVAARTILRQEYLPSVAVPHGVDVEVYEEQLFSRWSNSALGHQTSQVGSDGSVKLAQRVPTPACELLEAGVMPHFLALTIAAYICCIAPLVGFDPGPESMAMQDPARERLQLLSARAKNGHELSQLVFSDGGVFPPNLNEFVEFIERVGDFIEMIVHHGPEFAVRSADEATVSRLHAGVK